MKEKAFNFKNLSIGTSIVVDGVASKELYKNNTNGYKVQLITIDKVYEETSEGHLNQISNSSVTTSMTGYFEAMEGSNYRVRGQIGDYKGSNQIIVSDISFLPPADIKGIYEFLSSPLIQGIGKKLAQKLVYGWSDTKSDENESVFIKGFGSETLNIIRTDYTQLTRVPGITTKKALKIHQSYMQHVAYQEVVTFFLPFGVSPKQILKIYDEFKEKSIEIANTNPYKFISVEGFGFKTCDTIALKLGLNPKSTARIEACISYALQEASSSFGHCFLPRQELVTFTHDLLKITISSDSANKLLNKTTGDFTTVEIGSLSYKIHIQDLHTLPSGSKLILDEVEISAIDECLDRLLSNNALILNHLTKDELLPMCKDISLFNVLESETIPVISLPSIFFTERKVAQKVFEASQCWDFKDDIEDEVLGYISDFEKEQGYELESKQKLAVIESVKSTYTVITGPAGSGKTTTIMCLLYVLEKIHSKYNGITINSEHHKNKLITSLCAPTGKAAKRMEQTSKRDASTIHRLLESNGFEFTYDETNILDTYSVIIVDEFSMIDIFLVKALFSAIDPRKTKLIILGDPHQLDSVGAGNVLDDLVSSKSITHIELDVVKRQAEDSTILSNSSKIIQGEMIIDNKEKGDFYIINSDKSESVSNTLIESVYRFINKYNYSIDDIQVLSPQRVGPLGTSELNKKLQALVNPPNSTKKEVDLTINNDTVYYRVGDKVMHIANSYNLVRYKFSNNSYEPILNKKNEPICGVFNGETGVIVDILDLALEDEEMEKYVIVKFEDFYILYSVDMLTLLCHSFALTVHKSQGSQFPIVLMPIHYSHKRMLNKKIGYTAVTRAQEKVVLVGQPYAIKTMIETKYTTRRYTLLKKLLIEEQLNHESKLLTL